MVSMKALAKASWSKAKKAAKTKTGRKLMAQAKTEASEAFRKKLANSPMAAVVLLAMKKASGISPPKAVNGVNLNDTDNRDISISGVAIGDISTSSSIYAFRPPRKRSLDGVNYIQKTRAAGYKSIDADVQSAIDISILDAEPVSGNPDSNEKYSNLSIRKAFDDFLVASNIGSTDKLKLEQTSIHMKSLSCELNLTNNNSTSAIVDIYEVVPKHSLGPSPYVNANYANGYMSPLWCWSVGLSSDTPILEDTLLSTTVGSKPQDSVNFSRSFAVVKHVKVNLTGNSSHIHKSAYAINKTVTYQEMAQFSTAGGKFAGWNPTYLLRFRGVPTSSNPLACPTSISYYADMQLNYSGYMSEGARAIVFDTKT